MKIRSRTRLVQLAVMLATALLATGCDRGGSPLQDGFSWVVVDRLAAMPAPGSGDALDGDLAFLAAREIDLLVSLTGDAPDRDALARHRIATLHIPVEDFHPPTLEQQIEFVGAVAQRLDRGGRAGVHCTAGLGRSGTMLASYLVFLGRTADEAIAEVRAARPGSIETPAQEAAIRSYADHLRGR